MSAPQLSVLIRTVENQYQDCLKVNDEDFFKPDEVAKRVNALKAKINFLSNKFELFLKLKITDMSDSDFKVLDSSGRTTFLAMYLSQYKKAELIAFFQPNTKHALANL